MTSTLTRRSDMEGMFGTVEWAFAEDHVISGSADARARSLTGVHRTTKADGAVLVVGLGRDPGGDS